MVRVANIISLRVTPVRPVCCWRAPCEQRCLALRLGLRCRNESGKDQCIDSPCRAVHSVSYRISASKPWQCLPLMPLHFQLEGVDTRSHITHMRRNLRKDQTSTSS
jgi:hypothetical protein